MESNNWEQVTCSFLALKIKWANQIKQKCEMVFLIMSVIPKVLSAQRPNPSLGLVILGLMEVNLGVEVHFVHDFLLVLDFVELVLVFVKQELGENCLPSD